MDIEKRNHLCPGDNVGSIVEMVPLSPDHLCPGDNVGSIVEMVPLSPDHLCPGDNVGSIVEMVPLSPDHLCPGDNVGSIVEMVDMDEEIFAVSNSSAADAAFDAVIGCIEEIIMEEDFQQLQQSFMDKHYLEFDDSEGNKLTYTPIFNQYIELVEKHLEHQLMERIPGFNMTDFTQLLQQNKDELSGDVFDMLLTFSDFMAFKEMFLDYRAEKEGRTLDPSQGLVVKPLNSAACKRISTIVPHYSIQ